MTDDRSSDSIITEQGIIYVFYLKREVPTVRAYSIVETLGSSAF